MKKQLKAFDEASLTTKIIIVIVIIIVIYFTVKFLEQSKSVITDKAEELALGSQGIKATYSNSEYDSFASTLETAMAGLGTDEQQIFTVFSSLRNDVDFIKLNQSFGIREGSNMSAWLKGDLSTTDITTINSQLEMSGITKRI